MLNLLKNPARVAGTIFATAVLAVAQTGSYGQPAPNGSNAPPARQSARFARVGTVNYVEGQVRLDGQPISQQNIGSAVVEPGHVLQTDNGKAEMLLTPGVFVRLAPHSAVRMVTPDLENTHIELTQGQAMMEVAQFEKENHLAVTIGPANEMVKERGIYEFSANPAWVRTFDGKAEVQLGDRSTNVGKGDQVALDPNNPRLKGNGFDVKQTEVSDDLYAWSKLRADYTAQANMSAAAMYPASGPGWYGEGWYWDPYFDEYAFLLGDGYLWDPFGFGFFSPGYWGAYGGFFGRGYYGRGFYGGHGYYAGGAITRGSAAGAAIGGGVHGSGFAGGGFRSGVAGGGYRGGFAGGGFHGGGFGGGGFHGGGGGRR